jgi:hypothetical protein
VLEGSRAAEAAEAELLLIRSATVELVDPEGLVLQ